MLSIVTPLISILLTNLEGEKYARLNHHPWQILTKRHYFNTNCNIKFYWKWNGNHLSDKSQQLIPEDINVNCPRICTRMCVLKLVNYSLLQPNDCSHVDGDHKLKPSNIGKHGCIDRQSCKFLWIKNVKLKSNPKIITTLWGWWHP